jgi:chromatin assembly factor 1 subunit A
MTKFFIKPKAHVNGSKPQDAAVPGPSTLQSDFERVFKPFVLGKDKTLAPQNWFHDQKLRRRRTAKVGSKTEAIVLDSEDERDVEMVEPQPTEEELKAMTPLSASNLLFTASVFITGYY